MAAARVGLVLGAGGITGGAYAYGVLTALHERTGWEPATSRCFIGTSAGSWIAAFLASGRTLAEALVLARQPAPSGARPAADAALGDPSGLYTPRRGLPRISPFWWLRPSDLVAESGLFSTEGMRRRLRARLPDAESWPHPNLRLVAFDTRRLRRVVFGAKGAPMATLIDAVTASSAIPGVFRPVEVDGVPYLDGGIASTTNLDLAAEFAADLDLVVCIAPMAGERGSDIPPLGPAAYGRAFTATLTWIARRQLEREMAGLRRRFPALELLTFRPDAETRGVMGANSMDGRRREAARKQAYESTVTALQAPEMQAILSHFSCTSGLSSTVSDRSRRPCRTARPQQRRLT